MLDGGAELENRLGLVGERAVGVEGGDELEDGLGLVSEGAVDLGGGEWFVGGGALVLGEWARVDWRHPRSGGLAEECERHVELRGDLTCLGGLDNPIFERFEHGGVGGEVAECPGGDEDIQSSNSCAGGCAACDSSSSATR